MNQIDDSARIGVQRVTGKAQEEQLANLFLESEAAKILHTDREFTYKVLSKQLRITEKPILDSAYNAEIKALEPRMVIKTEALQAILEEVAPTDSRAKNVKPQELVDLRYLEEMEKSGFFEQLWSKK